LGAFGDRAVPITSAETRPKEKVLASSPSDRRVAATVGNRQATDTKNGLRVESVSIGKDRPNTKTVFGDISGKSEPLGNNRSSRSMVTKIQIASAEVRGALSKEVVRAIVQRHIEDVRVCYGQALVQTPGVAGRVAVKFIVSQKGQVQEAAVDSSNTNHAKLDDCIVNAVREWTFPAPEGGGVVVVTYPFTLSTSKAKK
jgi:TonB family protein